MAAPPQEYTFTPTPDAALLKKLQKQARTWKKAVTTSEPIDEKALKTQGPLLREASGMNQADLTARLTECSARGEKLLLTLESKNPEIQNLPWEILFHPNPEIHFPGVHPRLLFARRTGSEARVTSLPGPLRLLFVTPSPEDLNTPAQRLSYEKEKETIMEALEDLLKKGQVVIDHMKDGTLETLEQKILTHSYHALHISGHGTVDEDGKVYLIMEEKENWNTRKVSGEELGAVLGRSASPVPFVFLSACHSAAPGTGEAFGGICRDLLAQGVPFALGMSYPVEDEAATLLAQKFYTLLAAKNSLPQAMNGARHYVKEEIPQPQWTIPALFINSKKTVKTIILSIGTNPFSRRSGKGYV